MAQFIDPLAYARGASMANQDNWRDALNESTLRARDEALKQSQARFGVSLPYAEAAAVEKYNDLTANKRFAADATSILANMARLPVEQKDSYLVESVRKALGNIDPRQPGAGRYVDNFTNWISQNAAVALKSGNQQLHQGLTSLLPSARYNEAAQAQRVAQWSDPLSATNPALIKEAGGQLLPSGMVSFNGVQMYPSQFAELQQRRAKDPYSGATFDMINKLRQEEENRRVGFEGAGLYDAQGQNVLLNRVTGKLTPLPFLKPQQGEPTQMGVLPEQYGSTKVDWNNLPAMQTAPMQAPAMVQQPAPPAWGGVFVDDYGRNIPVDDARPPMVQPMVQPQPDNEYWYKMLRDGTDAPTYPEHIGGQ